ncbi:MAG: winged helix-turn-helix transcriptional regulator [Halodesulfurarchaeum sp.]
MDSAVQDTWHGLHSLFGSKWTFHVLRLLDSRSHRFNEMKRAIDGLTAPMLSRRLTELECHGFVSRSVEHTSPPSTTYRLTDEGRQITALLRDLEVAVEMRECEDPSSCNETIDGACVSARSSQPPC